LALQSAIEALTFQDIDLGLGHVELATMLRCVM
jgi:hypothetical protein